MSDEFYQQNVILSRRSCLSGSLLSLLGTIGYYGTYAYGIYLTLIGTLTLGTLTFLAGAMPGASNNIQALFSTFSHIADHALFLTDLIEFFSVRPKISSKPGACLGPGRFVRDLNSRMFPSVIPESPNRFWKMSIFAWSRANGSLW